ncbi:DUF444 family protein, partial [Patescibacteria group bacterium]|nr:DUF444 family protein [Patescibacteria group bacterium]
MERLPLSGAGAYFSIHREDWSLHRQGPIDQARHNEKVKEAIKENLGNIIAEEAIITSDGKSIVKVPIRGLELPRFRYTQGEQGVGQGAGDSQIGDVVGTVPAPGTNGEPRHAGEQPGVDYYDAEITVDELAELMFRDLELPNLQPKRLQEIETEAVSYYEVRKSGPMATLNKRRTALANIKRNALQRKKPVIEGVQNEDLRFRASTNSVSQESNAVVLAMRDVSGSMGEFEKYITRSVYFWRDYL